MITIEKIGEGDYEVTVEGARTTRHRVRLDPEVHQRLTGGRATPEDLLRRSFEFLLEREPNTSILGTFDLPVIGRYFPEYEQAMRRVFP